MKRNTTVINNESTLQESIQEFAMLSPAIILLIMFIIIPFVMSVPLSFTNQKLFPSPIPIKFIGFRNYLKIMMDKDFWQAMKNIFAFTILVLPIQCGFALFVAYNLNQLKRLNGLLRAIFFMPFITPMVIVTVIWATIYKYPTGVLNSFLQVILPGFTSIDWLGDPNTALFSIVLLSAWQAYGFQMIIYLAGLQNIPEEQYEAAGIDGAGRWVRFWYITMPGLKNTNIFVLTITTIQALKLFTQVNILTHGGPLGSTNTLVNYIYEAGFTGQKIGYSAAASVLMFLIVLTIVIIQRILLKKNEEK